MKNFSLVSPTASDFLDGVCRNGTLILEAVHMPSLPSEKTESFTDLAKEADPNVEHPPIVFRVINKDPAITDISIGSYVSISRFAGDPFGFRSKVFKVSTLDVDYVWGPSLGEQE